MPRALSIALFLLIAIGLIASLHYWFWIRLVRDAGVPPPWRTVATACLWLLGASMPAAMVIGRLVGPRAAKALAWPAYVWMGMMLLLMVTVGGAEILRLVARIGAGERLADPARRLFFQRVLGALAGAAATGMGAFALRGALRGPSLRELTIALPKLPETLMGMTIVQLTDLHVGPTLGRDFIDKVVAQVNALAPDVVAITGDLVDGSVEELRETIAPIASIKAKRGVYFVTGNHEYYAGAAEWTAHLGTLGVRVLRNERVALADGLDLAGVDDWNARGLAPGHGADLQRALDGRDPARALVLLAHQPRAFVEAAAAGVGLQLSGHTHGGQIWPWGIFVRLQQPYISGLYRAGAAQLYVSCGTGYWGPPMRLGAPSEITRVTLVPA